MRFTGLLSVEASFQIAIFLFVRQNKIKTFSALYRLDHELAYKATHPSSRLLPWFEKKLLTHSQGYWFLCLMAVLNPKGQS